MLLLLLLLGVVGVGGVVGEQQGHNMAQDPYPRQCHLHGGGEITHEAGRWGGVGWGVGITGWGATGELRMLARRRKGTSRAGRGAAGWRAAMHQGWRQQQRATERCSTGHSH